MAIFGIKTEQSNIVNEFMAKSGKRLDGHNFIKNPFNGKIRKIGVENNMDYWGIDMSPVYFPYYWYGLLGVIIILLIRQAWTNWAIMPLLLYCSGIFYSGIFFSIMLRIGLRKAGYKGKVSNISKNEVIKKLL